MADIRTDGDAALSSDDMKKVDALWARHRTEFERMKETLQGTLGDEPLLTDEEHERLKEVLSKKQR